MVKKKKREEFYVHASVIKPSVVRKVYQLYLKGKSHDDISLFLKLKQNVCLSRKEVDRIISDVNDALS